MITLHRGSPQILRTVITVLVLWTVGYTAGADSPPNIVFFLATDPDERNNLYNNPDHEKTVRDLKRQLYKLRQELGD